MIDPAVASTTETLMTAFKENLLGGLTTGEFLATLGLMFALVFVVVFIIGMFKSEWLT